MFTGLMLEVQCIRPANLVRMALVKYLEIGTPTWVLSPPERVPAGPRIRRASTFSALGDGGFLKFNHVAPLT
jgi:hypothetical protein